ncbi:hypothetical protein ON010_g17445 [Phytophthora cinnamomi]|nr:hypothetical protein ON010_g17445 [Phytophthora cinnamomi]
MDEKILLLWDDILGHWTQEVTDYAESITVVLTKVPPRYTYACQPADVAWNQPFKSRLRSRWVDCLRSQIADHHAHERNRATERQRVAEQAATIARVEIQEVAREMINSIQDDEASSVFVMEAPKRTVITSWITESWKDLSSKTIVSGFAKAGLLGDVRSVNSETGSDCVEDITDLLDKLRELGAAGRLVNTDDEYASSDSSGDDF